MSSPLPASVIPALTSNSKTGANPESESRVTYASTVAASVSSYTDTDHREERESKSLVNDSVVPQAHRFRFPPLSSNRPSRESERSPGLTFGSDRLNKRRKKRHVY